jgi:hypothetical protein
MHLLSEMCFTVYYLSSVSAVNAWRLRMRVTGNKEPFLNFMRDLVIEMFMVHGKPVIKKRPSTSASNARFEPQ